LPVREAEFGPVQGVLAVDPAGEAVADERRVHRLVEAAVHRRVLAQQAGDELRAVLIEKGDRLVQVGDDLQGHLGRFLPLPLAAELRERQALRERLLDLPLRAENARAGAEPFLWDVPLIAGGDVQLARVTAPLAGLPEGAEEGRDQFAGALAGEAADVEGVADLPVQRVEDGGGELPGSG